MRTCPSCGSSFADSMSFCPQDGRELVGGNDDTLAIQKAVVHGSYRLLDLLGEGGMGRVYKAEHVRLGRKVALKMLRPEFAMNPEAVKRFFAEARAVNQVAHETIVEITDFFEAEKEGEATFLIMELLEGESLRGLLDREPVPPLERSLAIVMQIADALAAVHRAGIVHRDLKPDNVFLVKRTGREELVKVLDFGIAKLRDPGDGRSMLKTAVGAVLGTPEYMSPEQAEGKARIDHRADVYALGVMLYEMVSGRKPITGSSTSETLIKQLTWMPPSPREPGLGGSIPDQLEALIMRCLAKQPEERPGDMDEVQLSLEAILERLRDPAVSGAVAWGDAPRPETTAPWDLEPRNVAVAPVPNEAVSAPMPVDRPPGRGAPVVNEAASNVFAPSTQPPAAAGPGTTGDAASKVAASPKRISAGPVATRRAATRRKDGRIFLIGLVFALGLIVGGVWFALRGSKGADESAARTQPPPAAGEPKPAVVPDPPRAAPPAPVQPASTAEGEGAEGVEGRTVDPAVEQVNARTEDAGGEKAEVEAADGTGTPGANAAGEAEAAGAGQVPKEGADAGAQSTARDEPTPAAAPAGRAAPASPRPASPAPASGAKPVAAPAPSPATRYPQPPRAGPTPGKSVRPAHGTPTAPPPSR